MMIKLRPRGGDMNKVTQTYAWLGKLKRLLLYWGKQQSLNHNPTRPKVIHLLKAEWRLPSS